MNNSRFALKSRSVVWAIAIISLACVFVAAFLDHTLRLSNLVFNWYGLSTAVATTIILVLLIFLLSRPSRNEERLWLSLYLALIVVYGFSTALQQFSSNAANAVFWTNFIAMGVIGGVTMYLFTLAYTNQTPQRFPGLTIFILLAAIIFAIIDDATNIVFLVGPAPGIHEAWGWDFRGATASLPLAFVLFLFYTIPMAAGIARLISYRRQTKNPILRTQSLIFIFAVSIPLLGGTIFDLILPVIGIDSIPPLTNYLAVPTALLLTYGIMRYQLLTLNPSQFSSTILAIMQEAVVTTDENFNIIFMNKTAEAMLNAKESALGKSTLRNFVAPQSLKKFDEELQAADLNMTHTIGQIDIIPRRSNTTIPVRVLSSRLKLAQHETRVIVLADITAELQTRRVIEHEVTVRTRELNEARAYLVSSINSLEQGFVLVNNEGLIEMVNHQAALLLKQSGEEANSLLQQPAETIMKRMEYDKDVAAAVTKTLSHHKGNSLSVSRSGSFYEIYITPVLSGSQLLGATVIIQDVTEQKILERSKDEFFSIASHELRTPLTAIRGNMSMVKDYFPEAMKDEALSTMVNDTHAASIRLIEIVNDFLDSSKLEQGKMQFSLQPVVVQPLVASLVEDLKPLLGGQHDQVTLTGLDTLPAILVDEGRFRQIMYNLLSNATKYSEHATITISGEATDKVVKLRVTDTGKGISPEGQKLLFHKFQQAGESTLTRDNTKGTGLGLYISRLLAQNMHGDVVLERSEVGKGSTFTMTLPVAKENKATSSHQSNSHPQLTA